MEFECSHCVAKAVESRQLKLLRELLQRPVAYRGLVWQPIGGRGGGAGGAARAPHFTGFTWGGTKKNFLPDT